MNLAEIRKKARKEKESSAEPSTIPGSVTASDVEDQVASTELDGLFPAMARPSLETDSGGGDEASVSMPAFDPMALIAAGRLSAGDDEVLAGAVAEERLADGEAFQEFLCFRVSAETYAINILDIKEIIKPREITDVPRVPAFVSGVLSLRGIIIPVFNMRKRLGLPAMQRSSKERIVVVKRGEDFCGVLVDEVVQVVRITVSSIEQPPAVLDGIDRDFVAGIGRHGGMMLILLNLHNILDINLC